MYYLAVSIAVLKMYTDPSIEKHLLHPSVPSELRGRLLPHDPVEARPYTLKRYFSQVTILQPESRLSSYSNPLRPVACETPPA